MIECGLGVVVACLPTLRPLLGRISPDAIFSSFRSVFSLQSLRSRTTPDRSSIRLHSIDASTSSHTAFAHGEDQKTPQFAVPEKVRDLENQFHVPGGKIVVETRIAQSAHQL